MSGFRAIDTAGQRKHYREDLVGEALTILHEKHGIKREDLLLQSKYTSIDGQDRAQPIPYDPSSPIADQVHSSLSQSLKNLRTTYLDSYILHSPLRTPKDTLTAWSALIKAQDEGLVKQIGISNSYSVELLQYIAEATRRPVQVVQNRWYEGNGWDTDVVSYCIKNDIQYQSFWTLSGSPTLLGHSSLRAVAKTHHITPSQALFTVAQARGIIPLCGTTSESHMREALAASELVVDVQSGAGLDVVEILEGKRDVRA